MTYKFTLTFILLLSFVFSNAQETISFVGAHPNSETGSLKSKSLKGSLEDTLELPFIDDFSDSYYSPNPDKWADNYAFINNTYAIEPPSIGVATLDAISNTGEFYSNAGYGNSFSADTLSSLPLNLDYPGAGDIRLSFYYQPQGLGDNPQSPDDDPLPVDSLLLEFYSPADSVWDLVWFAEGSKVVDFKRVVVAVTESKYLKKGFRFRFRNIASLSGDKNPSKAVNVDHWHIDYVYLNEPGGDLVLKDVAFTQPMKTHLKNYEAMPWTHFLANTSSEIGTNVSGVIQNNSDGLRLVNRLDFIFYDNSGNEQNDTMEAGAYNMVAEEQIMQNPPFTYPFLTNTTDTASFTIKARIITDTDDAIPSNNEVTYIQKFYDYYAYDDGTAEASYGLIGEGAQNARLAYKFNCRKEDTLKAVQMYFNRSLKDESQDYFYLTVWDNFVNNGKDEPGKIIYQKEAQRPEYANELNKYHNYPIDDTVLVLSGKFYVGWVQTKAEMLNVGLDFNRTKNQYIFYNINGDWANSSYEAALMIRPFFGPSLVLGNNDIPITDKNTPDITVFPNPVQNQLKIDIPNASEYKGVKVEIYNLTGKLMYKADYQPDLPIKISGWHEGYYLLRLTDQENKLNYTQKIIKTK